MAEHALLAPSSAHRWMHCPPSALLEAQEPDEQTSFSLEGTLAHAYCAERLKRYLHLPVVEEKAKIAELADYEAPEMDDYVAIYHNIVVQAFDEVRHTTPDAKLLVEVKLDFTKWIPDGFGTADAVIVGDGVLKVFDFKYGKGIKVNAEDNCQMMIYSLGALEAFNDDYNINEVEMTIVQPRIENISTQTKSADVLREWAEVRLVPRAKEAITGDGGRSYGAWCRFCRVRAKCPLLMGVALSRAGMHSNRTASDMEITNTLRVLPIIKQWLTAFEDMVQKMVLNGHKFSGFKLVEGRSVRTITDPQRLAQILIEAGVPEDEIYKPRELATLGALEKVVGKKRFAELSADVIHKPAGKPTLVPESDERPEIDTDDFADIPTD